ncbi:type II secretion system protein [Kineococcus sp. SYSU DK001]|uniref:type II secretion system protein n=1 Tax=Kineococcus sp. SYSU DK001 TaxID=3383122 RepID=UPI003D7E9B0B
MLARIRKSIEDKDQGFTLIELLVVMIIIGILAAIAIPVFLSQRAKARDTATKSDVSTVGKEISSYYVDGTGSLAIAISSGTYSLTETPAVAGAAAIATSKVSDGTEVKTATIVYSDTTNKAGSWCVALTNPNGTKKDWQYSAKTGLTQGACTTAGTY